LKIAFPRDEARFSRRFEMLGRRQYPKEHMAEAEGFKDTEKIPHIEGNEFANTF
jgi:hypothetical protein